MIKNLNQIFVFLLLASVTMLGCKKEEVLTIPPQEAHFNGATGTYFVTSDPNSSFKIPVGLTTVSSSARTISYTVSSPTGATAGAQYNITGNTVTIPAGQAVDSIVVRGIFAGFSSTRVDTLVFTINSADVAAAEFNREYRLVLRKSCDVVPANIMGNYTRSTDIYNGNPSSRPNYTANISNFTQVTATTATVVIKNLGATSDNGWGPFSATDPATNPGITATLNYSNPANLTVTIANQNYFNDGSGMSTITGTGTFSACDNTFRITCTVRYAGNGISYNHISLLNK
jgi:hypothetical protein